MERSGRIGAVSGRRVGMRLWLGAAFAVVTLITAASVYLFVDDSSGRTLRSESSNLAVGRTANIADQLSDLNDFDAAMLLNEANSETYEVWAIDREGGPLSEQSLPPGEITEVERGEEAIASALSGRRFHAELSGNVSVVSAPIFGERRVRGAVLARAEPPAALTRAFDDLRGDRLRALGIAIAIGLVVAFVVSSLITVRVKRLARAAEHMASGRFDAALPAGGGDEIGDLTRSLDSMRHELSESFRALATERDRLSAILDGMAEAVIVVGEEGMVRFTNPAGAKLVRGEQPAAALIPPLRRAAERGADEIPVLRIEGRVYGVHARQVPAEHAVLMVVRDRTEELKREEAEREFVSNAAHELRNPLAGISGAIEVLRGGAKDDPSARDRFLLRLADDAERMTRLTQSLLTLARMEAAGEREEAEVVDVTLAAAEAASSVERPEGIELRTAVEPDLVATGDPVLLGQVLIGLLSNACKHMSPPGRVTLRAFRSEGEGVTIEVEDTGRGIPESDRDRVFERFYRGAGAVDADGFGLGLAIARRMVDVMGGEIGFDSEPGRGTTFWVRLREPKPTTTPVA